MGWARGLLLLVFLSTPLAVAGASPPFLLASTQQGTALAAPPAGAASATVALSNEGRVPLHLLAAPVRVPPGWEVSVEPARKTLTEGGYRVEANLRLDPGGRAAVTLTAKPGPGASGGALQLDLTAAHLSPEGRAMAILTRALLYDLSVSASAAGASGKNETIVAGLSDYPIKFGVIRPGVSENASSGAGFPLRVSLERGTDIPVTLSLRGSDFSAGSLTFPSAQMGVSSSAGGPRVPVALDFRSLLPGWEAIAAGRRSEAEIYFWLEIPKGQPPGQYANTVAVGLSREGLRPLSPDVPLGAPLPSPLQATTPPHAPSPKPSPGFEIAAALAALLVGNVLYPRARKVGWRKP
ncbi:MAG: hypothetical protein QXT68_04505 [Halobacteria archaeon]